MFERQFFTSRHANHPLHQIQARDGLGDWMFHLQAGVHFQEVEALVFTHHELDGARTLVFHRFGQGHGLCTHGLAGLVADERRWSFFNHLLMTTLNRAFALVQKHHVAVTISQ